MPMRTGVSPRAVITKGAASCETPTTRAAFRIVRRSRVVAPVSLGIGHLLGSLLVEPAPEPRGCKSLTVRFWRYSVRPRSGRDIPCPEGRHSSNNHGDLPRPSGTHRDAKMM